MAGRGPVEARLPAELVIAALLAFGLLSPCRGAEISVESSPLIREVDGGLWQALLVDLRGDAEGEGVLQAFLGGETYEVRVAEAERFLGRYVLLVPEVAAPTACEVRFLGREGEVCRRLILEPQRHWKVFFCHHTHMDIGFTDRQEAVWGFYADNLDAVLRYIGDTAGYPEGSRFRWTCECSAEVRNYERRRPRKRLAQFLCCARSGDVEVCGFYLNELTELLGDEALIRALYYAEYLRDRYGVDVESAMIDDIPGYTWALPALLSRAGVKYLNLRANRIRGQFLWWREGAPPRLFWWESPDGSRVLTWYTDSYRDGNFFREPGAYSGILAYIRRLEEAGYPYDAFQLRMGGDNNPASAIPCDNARAWNETWAYPRVILATNGEFFRYMERYAEGCPVFRGDIPDWWADGAASSARETGLFRAVQDKVSWAETTLSLLALHGLGGERRWEALLDRAYEGILLFGEHTWGANVSVREPYSRQTLEQWAVKRGYVEDAAEAADALARLALRGVASAAGGEGDRLLVYNPLPWERGGPVEGSGGVAALAPEPVPSCGWAFLPEGSPSGLGADIRTGDGYMENAFYRLAFDPREGRIVSILDKELGVEVLDASSPWAFNQYIYERFKDDEYEYVETPGATRVLVGELIREASGPARFRLERGSPWMVSLFAETSGPRAPRITQVYTLYSNLKRIDVSNTVEKEETLEKEAVYFAFPFRLGHPHVKVEIPDAAMMPEAEQLPFSCRDFYSVAHWADLWTEEWGVTLVCREAPLLEFGDITTERWADALTIPRGTVFSYVMNNHWMVNYRAGQGGRLRFRYHITTHKGGHDPVGAHRFGCECAVPLLAAGNTGTGPSGRRPPSRSLARVSPAGVFLQVVKPAEDGRGFILRLREIAGEGALARVELPGAAVREAWLADIVENDRRRIPVGSGTFSLRLEPYSIATVRLLP